MTYYEYTREYPVTSHVIHGVWYNANDNTVVLDVNDKLYRYSGVSDADVDALLRGDGYNGSVGRHYNLEFKHTFGPAEYLCWWDNGEPEEVPVRKDMASTTVPKDFVNANDVRASEGLAAVETPTREYSLQTPAAPAPAAATGSDVKSTVYFTIDGGTREYSFEGSAADLDDAIGEVDQYVRRLGAKGKATRVVFEFV